MDDMISRQAAIDAIRKGYPDVINSDYKDGLRIGTDRAIYHVEQLSSAQPEKRTQERTETHACDLIDRQEAIKVATRFRVTPGGEIFEAIRMAVKTELEQLPSAQPEPCEDTVSRQRLLSDLKELVAAWKKYPVMAEQIKGVEAAIGYVEAIPSAQPQRWIPCSERLPEPYEHCLWTTIDGRVVYHHYDGLFSNYTAWMPLPEPYQEGE